MSALSSEEKVVGRAFRTGAEAYLAALCADSPATYRPLPVNGLFRHNCEKRRGISTAIQLKEVYLHSADRLVLPGEPHVDAVVYWEGEPTDRFAFIFKYGECKACKQTARSEVGMLVDATDRAPIEGKVARSGAGT